MRESHRPSPYDDFSSGGCHGVLVAMPAGGGCHGVLVAIENQFKLNLRFSPLSSAGEVQSFAANPSQSTTPHHVRFWRET